MSYIDDMIKRMHARINNSKLGPIKAALSSVKWTISGDSGYQCIKDDSNGREFRLYDNGTLYFLSGYSSSVGAWGDYTRKVEIKDLDAMMKTPDWYSKLIKAKTSAFEPTVIMM